MNQMINLVMSATGETLVMVFFSTLFSLILGLPIGVLLHVTSSEERVVSSHSQFLTISWEE